jgi:hypothetical protein
MAKRKKQIQSEKKPIFKSYEMLKKVRCVVAHRRNKKTMYDEERVRGRKMQIEEKVEERSEMKFFLKERRVPCNACILANSSGGNIWELAKKS